jgi:hypothetical protein
VDTAKVEGVVASPGLDAPAAENDSPRTNRGELSSTVSCMAVPRLRKSVDTLRRLPDRGVGLGVASGDGGADNTIPDCGCGCGCGCG